MLSTDYNETIFTDTFDTTSLTTIDNNPDDAINICSESICVNHMNYDTFPVLDENDNLVKLKRGSYQKNHIKTTLT